MDKDTMTTDKYSAFLSILVDRPAQVWGSQLATTPRSFGRSSTVWRKPSIIFSMSQEPAKKLSS